jgi:alpha-galactosidase
MPTTTQTAFDIRSHDTNQTIETDLLTVESCDGVIEHTIEIKFPTLQVPAPITIEWFIPLVDIAGKWHPLIMSDRSLTANWCEYIESYATMGAPVFCLFSESGENRQTFALSDAINPIRTRVQVEEDTAEVKHEVVLFHAPTEAIESYTLTIRIDTRPIPYHQALSDISNWWAAMPEYEPSSVPKTALDPVYSTWYSFHQHLSEASIEGTCEWSKQFGCKTIIVDDGWQTDDSNKGYQFCGDWEIAPSKFPDFKAHVARVQAMNMRYMLWFSVPYAGRESQAWKQFSDRILPKPFQNADCLDPRYPEVRSYLKNFYHKAIADWKLDGLKLDFVDQFTSEIVTESRKETIDMCSVPAAADRLLSEMIIELQAINPDVLIEFRQNYIGPAMRKYGNTFRAQDCPNDALSNRIRTIDIRLLSGNTAVHSDMIMWNSNESPEQAALQLWAALFSVPQISVKPDGITEEQEQMLHFYLDFWTQHRDLVLHGQLTPCMPQLLYPLIYSENSSTLLAALYQSKLVVEAKDIGSRTFILVNASSSEDIIIDFGLMIGSFEVDSYDCKGNNYKSEPLDINAPLYLIQVPRSGVAVLTPTH